MAGLFVTLEGIEGCGKTTQAELLRLSLEKEGRHVVFTREPGGTEVGERIREVLLDNRIRRMEPLTELFLYLASRAQHVQELIRPALKEGAIVICDRFADASLAYQGAGRGIGTSRVLTLNEAATYGLVPDYTVLVDLPVELGLRRMSARLGGRGQQDRIEQEETDFHVRVREAYLALAQKSSGRIEVFDGTHSKEEIAQKILSRVTEILSRK